MRRRCYTGLSAAVLAAASLQAPFAHVHPADPDHHHARGLAHSHLLLRDHESQEREWETHDVDGATVYLDWAPAAAQRIAVSHTAVPAGSSWQPDLVIAGALPEPEAQAHSPPQRRLPPARAPPV